MNLLIFENLIFNFNFFIIFVSCFIFIFSKKIIWFLDTTDLEKKHISDDDEKNIKKKIRFLHLINIFIIANYFLTLLTELDFLNSFIKVLFIILFMYITNAWCVKKILMYYGDEVEISWEKFFRKWYKASFFSFLTQSVFIIIWFFLSIETLWINNYLQIGGIIAWVIAFFGFTATVWAPDVIAGIIILHNDRLQVGNVIRIKELWVYGWIKKISLSEIKLIDLTYSHPIYFRPANFRNYTIENLSAGIVWKKTVFTRIIEIKVNYEVEKEVIEDLCNDAYSSMLSLLSETEKKYFPLDSNCQVEIQSFWDNAVIYKLTYHINSPFFIIKAEQLFNRYLQIAQKKHKINFATPRLIDIQKKS